MTTSQDPIFHKERKNTDNSLDVEREKTNHSLENAKAEVELQTDENVQEERSNTDMATSAARTKADSTRNQRRLSGEKDSPQKSDEQMNQERLRIDAAVELERAQVDIAIVQEREIKNSIETKLFDQERKQTDLNLAVERTRTDSVVQTTTLKLSTEVAEHSRTKASLTTRDEFLAIVSHDLRNPIGAISSCMEILLQESAERKIDADTKSWLELAKRSADSSLRLISDILDMERIAEGKLEMAAASYDIGKIIRETMQTFVHQAASKNIVLRSSPETVAGEIICDHDRIVQVLSNLIGNALKFTPENGEIVLKVEWTPENVTIAVCDNGPGIPNDKKEQIFERFAQLGSKDRTGLGLGLHISKMLVEAHDGKLWVESKVGEGSAFYVQLPLRPR
jgi:signal transduction histidine kinase